MNESHRKNKFRRDALLIAAAAFLFFVPAPSNGRRSGDPELDRAIKKANAEFVAAMKTGDAATIAAPYADDGVFIAFDGNCIRGRREIEKMYRARFDSSGFASGVKVDSKRLVIDGDLAYESGYAEITSLKQGKVSVDGGRFLTIWQRQADGDWKILRNVVLP